MQPESMMPATQREPHLRPVISPRKPHKSIPAMIPAKLASESRIGNCEFFACTYRKFECNQQRVGPCLHCSLDKEASSMKATWSVERS
jgi:hypothetical protein